MTVVPNPETKACPMRQMSDVDDWETYAEELVHQTSARFMISDRYFQSAETLALDSDFPVVGLRSWRYPGVCYANENQPFA